MVLNSFICVAVISHWLRFASRSLFPSGDHLPRPDRSHLCLINLHPPVYLSVFPSLSLSVCCVSVPAVPCSGAPFVFGLSFAISAFFGSWYLHVFGLTPSFWLFPAWVCCFHKHSCVWSLGLLLVHFSTTREQNGLLCSYFHHSVWKAAMLV